MGRVAKYKKIKSFDPYSKKNGGRVNLARVGIWGLGDVGQKVKKRSKTSERLRSKKKQRMTTTTTPKEDAGGFDLPPNEKDEFDMKDLSGSIKKQSVNNPMAADDAAAADSSAAFHTVKLKGGNVATIPKTDRDEKKIARVLKIDTQVKEKIEKKVMLSHARMEGESKRAYQKRTKTETRQIIQKNVEINKEKRQKKKDFMNEKKKRKKGASTSMNNNSRYTEDAESDDEGGSFITGERAVALAASQPRFGEQAERPPVFRQLPRGAKAKQQEPIKMKSKGMTDTEVEAEKDAMEMMRRRVQAQYAAIKLKRRLAGDFHL